MARKGDWWHLLTLVVIVGQVIGLSIASEVAHTKVGYLRLSGSIITRSSCRQTLAEPVLF